MEINKIKIFIPSKNRLDNEKTYKILKELNLEPILVVEPQEYDKAISLGFNCISLDKNNQGITYARNFILNYCRKNNIEFASMMDDDIMRFGKIINSKRDYKNEYLLDALKYFLKEKCTGTLQSTQFAWCQKEPIVYNKCIQCVMFLYIPQITINFNENVFEDKDFSLELIINKNIKTFRLNHYFFSTYMLGKNKGGINHHNRIEKQLEWSINMYKKWGPEIIQIVNEKSTDINKLPNIKINWNTVKKIINNGNQLKLI